MTYAFRSPAKINPHLRVVGRRPDGYHELRVLFQTIDLFDRLEFASADLDKPSSSRGTQAPASRSTTWKRRPAKASISVWRRAKIW